ncbi:MAG: S-layer homology domain-containing protein [Gudongella sp.]|nr:S-layer homology domain-containing protein [Gudongella sp.]
MNKKILSWVLSFTMVLSMLGGLGQVAFGQAFTDVSTHWAKDDIEAWSGKGLISGYGGGTFKPDDKITRAEFVKLINNVINIQMEDDISFMDVEESDWYYKDLKKAIYGEYIRGYEDNSFRANDFISRQEAAAVLKNLVQLVEEKENVLGQFSDTDNTPDWSKAALMLAVQKGYLTGYTDGTLKASNHITRAESVKVLDNLFGTIYNEPGVYGPTIDEDALEVNGNVTVSVEDVTLQNMIIDGDLYLAEGIGEGDVTLDNITVTGETIVKGGGDNSIIIRNSSLNNLLIIKKDGNIRIIGQGSTSINNTYLHSSAKIESQGLNSSFGAVEIIRVTPGVAIELEGSFTNIDLKASARIELTEESQVEELNISKDLEDVNILVSRDSRIEKLYANSEIDVENKGTILRALGDFAKNSSYDFNLPVNLQQKTSSGSTTPIVTKYDVSLSVAPAEAGTVIGEGSYREGTVVTLTAAANEGYEFVEWREGDTVITTSSSFSHTIKSESKTFTAYFQLAEETKYTLSLEADPVGSGTLTGSGSYEEGTEITITATANEGYEFVEWKDGANQITTSSTFTYTSTTENKTLTAYFESTGVFAGGSGTEDNPYQVGNADQLNEVRNYLQSHFIQIDDIDLGASPWNEGEGWNPIGSASAPFSGSYDGDGYSIEGLHINRPSGKYQGLFGYASSESVLKNIDMENTYVSADQYTGTLAGYSAGEISNGSSVNVEVLNGWDYAGGLVGFNQGTISYSSTTGIVKTSDFNAGGLVGTNYGEITDCFSEAQIAPVGVAEDGYPYQMGGLVGYNSGGSIEDSYAIGDVTGWETIGGLVGENYDGSIISSYATGDVTGNEEYIGGLVGINGYNSLIRDSYATGSASGVYYIGGLVGDNYGTISESYAESNASGSQYVGGLAGYSGYGEIRYSYSIGDVTGTMESIGGIVGSAQNTAIYDCYAIGTVAGGSYIGGLAGYLSIGSSVTNCYSTGQVSGSSYEGGLIGSKATVGTIPTVDDSYYDAETSNQSDNSGKGVPKTTAELKSLSTYVGWDFPDVWTMNPTDNDGYPALYWQGFDHEGEFAGGSGTVSDPYQVETAEHLNNVRKYLDAHFIQIADIDLSEYVTSGGDYYYDGKGWEPIGSLSTPFTGSYDGDNGNITNLTISGSDSRIGLFGTTSETSFIHDLNLIDVSIDGSEFIGGIVGVSYGTIEACSVSGTIEGIMSVGGIAGWARGGEIKSSSGSCTISNKTPTQGSRLGIIVGDNEAAIIESCTGSGIVQGIGSVGGIVGLNRGSGEIRDSFSDATVTGTTNYAGGLVGESQGTISSSYSTGNASGGGYVGGLSGYNSGTIDKSFALGSVTGADNFVGGLVGMNDATISNSYAYGDVFGDQYVGGLTGINGYYNSSSTLSNCYSTGVVNGTFRWGGLVGYNSIGTISSCYWNTETSGMTASAGGIGYTSSQMTDQTNFVGWDFDTVWDIDGGISYPYLR